MATRVGAIKTKLICMRLEKNNRTWICFDPILQLAEVTLLRMTVRYNCTLGVDVISSSIGAIFCHVRNIMVQCFDILPMTTAPQKWNGASLTLRSRPISDQLLTCEL